MNFKSRFSHRSDAIDINVIPLIDVLLVVLIFLLQQPPLPPLMKLA